MADELTFQATASQRPLHDAIETLLKQLFFVHTHWGRLRNDLDDGPTLHHLGVVAYHLRGILKSWLLDGGYGESQELVEVVEKACKHLETVHWTFWNHSISSGRPSDG